jgi:hypothetical protein
MKINFLGLFNPENGVNTLLRNADIFTCWHMLRGSIPVNIFRAVPWPWPVDEKARVQSHFIIREIYG